MKRKIICLAICIVYLVAMLASCGSKEVEPCATHADVDKNTVCDGCGLPVITITEKVPTEEEVIDMIVAAIPDGATIGDVYAIATDKTVLNGKFELKENFNDNAIDMLAESLFSYYYTIQTKGADTTAETWPSEEEWTGEEPYDADGYLADDKYTVTYAIYDVVANKDIFSFTTAEYATDVYAEHVNDIYDVSFDGFFINVTTRVWTKTVNEFDPSIEYWNYGYSNAYYFKDGALFVDEAKVAEGEIFYAPQYVDTVADVVYYTVGNDTYAFDTETCATLAKGPTATFVKRPVFTYMTDTLGVVQKGNEYFVYDLSKWIECVYSYEAPANARAFILNNGNLLVEQSVVLPDSAVNYDYTDGASKYDLVHTVVDIAAKTTANLELGYFVDNVLPVEEESNFAEGVKNRLFVRTIENKNLAKELSLLCDDALAIVAEESSVLPEFVSNVTLKADGVFLGTVVYGEGSQIRKLYNAKGEEIATLPNGAVLYDTYIYNDGKFYDFTMKLILDPLADEENPFIVNVMYDEYVLLTNGADIYYWNAAAKAPVKIVDTTNVEMVPSEEDEEVLVPTEPNPLKEQDLYKMDALYYIVKTTTTTVNELPLEEGAPEGQEPETETVVEVEYVLYNAAGTEIFKSEEAIYVSNMEFDGELVWVISAGEGYYFQK